MFLICSYFLRYLKNNIKTLRDYQKTSCWTILSFTGKQVDTLPYLNTLILMC